jgi:hypothetical protein
MLTITFVQNGKSASAQIPTVFAPALHSAIAEIRGEVGERIAGSHKHHREESLTRAIAALGEMAAALNFVVPEGDPHYGN